MAFVRVTEADMDGKGNIGQPDIPGVSTLEMQRILDELPREVLAPAHNQLADQLEAATAAASLGAAPPEALPQDTSATVQGVLEAVLEEVQAHAARADNPHAVTAAQTGAYTKAEADAAIARRVVEIGTGDMAQAVYDPTGQKKDVFAACATAEQGAKADTAVQTVNGRSGPAVTLVPELLWTNPAPGQAFEGQSVSFDTKNYTWFIVQYAAGNGNRFAIVKRDVLSALVQNTYYNYCRTITISTNTALIRDCTYYPAYGNSQTSTYNSGCLPSHIYGLM